jgi:hypothetical protein
MISTLQRDLYGCWGCIPLAAAAVRVVANTGVAITVGAGRARTGTVTAARVLCLMLVSIFQEGCRGREPAEAVVRIDVEFTLTCATPRIRARML